VPVVGKRLRKVQNVLRLPIKYSEDVIINIDKLDYINIGVLRLLIKEQYGEELSKKFNSNFTIGKYNYTTRYGLQWVPIKEPQKDLNCSIILEFIKEK
jgi:hypothetical protein